ncbi:MAG: ubiquinone/menaquinone biosynthesis C-methylase UbiE [Rhodothermales bacterium]|jgi:ubiquinone/menaquinone biosynthesis C-methylase UbiE
MQQTERVSKYWDNEATAFDALYGLGEKPSTLNRLIRRGMFERVELTLRALKGMKVSSVLDVGSGSGRNSADFIEYAGVSRVVGVDFSPQMVALAKAHCEERGYASHTDFHLGDVLDVEFSEQFEAVVALGVFDYVEEAEPFLARLRSLSSGVVMASFPGYSFPRSPLRKMRYAARGCPIRFYGVDEVRQIGLDAGFSKVEVTPFSSAGRFLIAHI